MNTSDTAQVKRFRVYYRHYDNWVNNSYPMIRIGGKYLSHWNFEIGDTIEVTFEHGRITIAKAPPPVCEKPTTKA